MRATMNTAHRTIDLTTTEPRIVPIRTYEAASRQTAIDAFRTTRRRRLTRATIDTAADAAMATGGLALTNVALRLNIGLPDGIAGLALGAGLLAAGAAIALGRRGRRGGTDPSAAPIPTRVIVLDRIHPTVIDLEAHEKQHVA